MQRTIRPFHLLVTMMSLTAAFGRAQESDASVTELVKRLDEPLRCHVAADALRYKPQNEVLDAIVKRYSTIEKVSPDTQNKIMSVFFFLDGARLADCLNMIYAALNSRSAASMAMQCLASC